MKISTNFESVNRSLPFPLTLTPKIMKKHRTSDTVTGAVNAMLDAALPLPTLPAYVTLRAQDKPFWAGVVSTRARSDWAPVDLVLAAQLARCQCDIESEQQALYMEGTVIRNDRGTMVTNPRFRALNELKQSQLATVRALALNATAKSHARDIGNRNAVARSASRAREEIEDDELLAR